MVVVDGKRGGLPFALREAEHLTGGEVDDPSDPELLGRHEDVPCSEHVGGDDVSRSASGVVRDCAGVDDGITPVSRGAHGLEITEVESFSQIKGSNRPPCRFEHRPGGPAHAAGGARQKHSWHPDIVARWSSIPGTLPEIALKAQPSGVAASSRRRTSEVCTPSASSSAAAGSGGWRVRIWANTWGAVT